MKSLKITENQHKRIDRGAKKTPTKLAEFAGALLDYSLDKFETGEIQLAPAAITETSDRSVQQTQEAGQ